MNGTFESSLIDSNLRVLAKNSTNKWWNDLVVYTKPDIYCLTIFIIRTICSSNHLGFKTFGCLVKRIFFLSGVKLKVMAFLAANPSLSWQSHYTSWLSLKISFFYIHKKRIIIFKQPWLQVHDATLKLSLISLWFIDFVCWFSTSFFISPLHVLFFIFRKHVFFFRKRVFISFTRRKFPTKDS